MRVERLFANQIVAAIGRIIATIFIGLGFFYNPFLIVIGLFIFWGAGAETQVDDQELSFLEHAVEEVTTTAYHVLQKSDPIQKAVQLCLDKHINNAIVMDGQTPYGTLSLHGIIKALSEGDVNTTIDLVTNLNLVYVDYTAPIEDALLLMQQRKVSLLLVTKNKGLLGVLDQQSILDFLCISMMLPTNKLFK
jgi:signal-transduction protein with cAMP-binding, CBS, and nucleotidyltransferase domain